MKRLPQYVSGNSVELVLSGQPYFDTLYHIITHAHGFLHLQVYAWTDDATGRLVLDALVQATARGVKVFVIADSYGTRLPDSFRSRMTEAGILFRYFSPTGLFRIGRRMHQKVVVSGSGEAMVGGINISDKYRGNARQAPWLDFAVRVHGPLVAHLVRLCEHPWRKRKNVVPAAELHMYEAGNTEAQAVQNNGYRGRRSISRSYRSALAHARDEVWLVASYFLPGRSMRKSIEHAAARGVKIHILLSGISDVPFTRAASRFLYDWLFRCGVEIYEWHGSVLHGKVMVVDGEWATVGSYNVNKLSDYGSVELNVQVRDRKFAHTLRQAIVSQLPHTHLFDRATYARKTGWLARLGNWFSYQLLRLSLRVYLWLSDDSRF